MANLTASLYWHTKTESGWRRFPVLFAKNGRIKTGFVVVDSVERHYPEGTFHLRTYGAGSGFRNVGKDASEALAQLKREQKIREAKADLKSTGVTVIDPGERQSLMSFRDTCLDTMRLRVKGRGTVSRYEQMIDGFLLSTRRQWPEEVTKPDVLRYFRELGERYAQQTLFLNGYRVLKFLRYAGVPESQLPNGRERPTKPKTKVTTFDDHKLYQLLDGSTGRNALIWETFLKTGLRERELTTLEPSNFQFRRYANVVMVRPKPELKFFIKDHEERDIPLEDTLAEKLKNHMERNRGRRFVFGTLRDKPPRHLLLMLKRQARRQGLNCGHCAGCRRDSLCYQWKLKTFRATFATSCIQRGMDVRTLMELMGHSDMETTMKYLAAADIPNVQQTMNLIWKPRHTQVIEMPEREAS
jgi:integrase/recombinase XerD